MAAPTGESISRADGVTWRAVLIAIVVLVLSSPAAFMSEIVWGKGMWGNANYTPPPWPMTVLFLLGALAAHPRLRRRGLTRRELLVVYAVVLVGASLMTRTVLFYVVPKAIIYYHAARQNPVWETTFIQYLPWWFAPSSPAALQGFFLGGARVPWGEWAVPLAAWFSVMLALFGASFCLIILIHKQWVEHERLTFPLAEIPLRTVSDPPAPGAGRAGRLPRSPGFWFGAAAAVLLTTYGMISVQVPALPAIPMTPVKVTEWQGIGPIAGLGAFYLNFSPALLGIIYIIPKEISFSCWFFWLLRLATHVIAIAAGIAPQKPESWSTDFPAPYQTGAGATIAFGLWAFWIARRHLFRAVRTAFSAKAADVGGEGTVLYRVALLGFVVCFGWLLVFCWLVGCRLIFGLALMTLIIGTFLVWARVRADTALEPCVSEGYGWLLAPINSRSLRPQEVVTLVSMRWATFPVGGMIFSAPVLNSLEALKIGNATGVNVKRLSFAIFAGFVIALIVGMLVMVAGIYHYGYFGTHTGAAPYWPSLYNRLDGGVITALISNPGEPDHKTMVAMGAGGVISIALGLLRLRYWWWPFHPVGFIVAMGWGLIDSVVPFVLAWAAKVLVIRYGGLKLYRRTLPVVIGVIVGGLVATSLWSLASLPTGGRIGPPNY